MAHQSTLNIDVGMSASSYAYLESCARIRRISCTRMIERLIRTIADEQLVLSVLDDDSKQVPKLPGEKTVSHYYRKHRSVFS